MSVPEDRNVKRLVFLEALYSLVADDERTIVSSKALGEQLSFGTSDTERIVSYLEAEGLVRAQGFKGHDRLLSMTHEGIVYMETRDGGASSPKLADKSLDPAKVFVVHGRDLDVRDAMFRFLRAIGLQPIEWDQAVMGTGDGSPFIGQVLEEAFRQAQAVVVLLTGDDLAILREDLRSEGDQDYESRSTPQARPNVLFEAGMAFATHPTRTILVQLGAIRPFSDVAGRHVVHLNNATQKRQGLADRLRNAGCAVDVSGTAWHTEGSFAPAASKSEPEIEDSHDEFRLAGEEEVILQLLLDSSREEHQLARVLRMHPQKLQYFLHELEGRSLISSSWMLGLGTSYELKQAGRAYLVKRGLL